jgi:hypothetical protein
MLSKNRVQFIFMHHVFDDQLDSFHTLLESLGQDHRFIGYSDAVSRILNDSVDAPYIALTFDDGLKNCAEISPILKKYGISAIFFICPPFVGECRFDRVRRFCVERLGLPPVELMSWDDVSALLDQGHEIGSHTLHHLNLAAISANEAHDEICGSFDQLSEKIGRPSHFAWPFGRFFHFSSAARESVFKAGFETCASAERGCHQADNLSASNLCIRRDHVISTWPLSHVRYFLANSARRMSVRGNRWPHELAPNHLVGDA